MKSASLPRGLLWISPWIVGFALFMAAPIWMSLYYSLTDYAILEPPIFIGLENYRELLGDPLFWVTIRNTALFAAASVVLSTVLAIALAMLLARPGRGIAAARAIVFLPTLVPLVAAALAWMWMYNGEFGLINLGLGVIGLEGPDWLGDRHWAMTSLVIMGLWQVGGAVVICIAALQDVPTSLYEAADIDGVSPWGRFRHVTLPMISPAVLFNVVMSIIWSIQVFAVPHIMTRGGPEHATYFYSMYVYDNAFQYGRMGYASALAWIQLLVILVLTGGVLALSRRFVYYRAA